MSTDPSAAIFTARNISKSFGAQPILVDASLTVHEGDRIGLIGRNGTGKSTLMRILTGLDTPTSGEIVQRQGLRVTMLGQEGSRDVDRTVEAHLKDAAAEVLGLLDRHDDLTRRFAARPGDEKLASELEWIHHELDMAGAWRLDEVMKRVSVGLQLPDGGRVVKSLSGGELRRLDMARVLIQHPDLLLLDEPTNHIDMDSVQWMEDFLAGYRGSVILVTHDRYFLERVATRIVELEHGCLTSYPGNYSRYLELKAERVEQAAREEANRQGFLRRELVWIRAGAKARTTKQKARIKRFDAADDADGPIREREMAFELPQPPRLGKVILEAEGLARSIGGVKLFEEVNLSMQHGMRVGIAGPNGCGKTTLLRVLMGADEPDKGDLTLGESTEFLYVDQHHEEVHPDMAVLQHVSGGSRHVEVNGRRVYVPGYLERFLFDGSVINMVMGRLSGGERNRVNLAKKMLQGGNVLVLDEPTNDLDLQTLRVLEEAVQAFDGCALIVSHDRYFLDRLCTHLLVFEGGGRVVPVTGNWQDYRLYVERREQDRQPAAEPKPTKQTKAADPTGSSPRRLTWKEKNELETMEGRILECESVFAELEAEVSAPGFYENDRALVQDRLTELERTRNDLDGLYARWQELESLNNQA